MSLSFRFPQMFDPSDHQPLYSPPHPHKDNGNHWIREEEMEKDVREVEPWVQGLEDGFNISYADTIDTFTHRNISDSFASRTEALKDAGMEQDFRTLIWSKMINGTRHELTEELLWQMNRRNFNRLVQRIKENRP